MFATEKELVDHMTECGYSDDSIVSESISHGFISPDVAAETLAALPTKPDNGTTTSLLDKLLGR
jgi:hypothetical protein